MSGSWEKKAALAGLALAAGIIAAVALRVGLPPATPSVAPPLPRVAVDRDLDAIAKTGVLVVAMRRDEVAYDRRRGRDEGLAYELARSLADTLDLELQVVPTHSPAQALRDLGAGTIDVAAWIEPGPAPFLDEVAWTPPLELSHPVVVGREAEKIESVADLAGQRVAVLRHSALEQLAHRWKEELGGDLEVIRLPIGATARELAHAAASRRLPLALIDQRRAQLEAAVIRPLTLSKPLGPALPVRWCIRPRSPALSQALENWIEDTKRSGRLAEFERRYLENPLRLKSRRRPVFRYAGATLSPYDGLFRREATRHGFDWRLIAALSFTESGYDRWEVSSRGAIGLLQLMPRIARAYGAEDPFDPAQNVAAGASLLRWLYDLYDEVPEPDRLAFVLASYNMGMGHLEDARALAAMRGLHPDRWEEGVARVLPLLEDPLIAKDLPHGFARGRVTRRYVKDVLHLYERMQDAASPPKRQQTARAQREPTPEPPAQP